MLRLVIRFFFKHLVELFIFSGLLLLMTALMTGWYVQMRDRQQIVYSYSNLKSLVDALQLYSFDNPDSQVFPPVDYTGQGVVLCPVRENNIKGLSFLTTPTSYIHSLPHDPFMKQSMGKNYDAPAVLHWVKQNGNTPFTHIGWGAMSVGPALMLPPQYSIQALQEIPFSTAPLHWNLFDASNGLRSLGILYHDSLGNSNAL